MSKILLIEDNAALRRNLRDILALDGHEVQEAASGPEGLRLARECPPDLVLCDIMLPGCDGHEVLATLRANPDSASLPFIFLTARGEPSDIRAGMNLGADDYLPKPVSRADLTAAIRTRLARTRQQRGRALNFSDPQPLRKLGLSAREAEVLLWIAQGKSNGEIGVILGCSQATAKKHSLSIFEKLGVEGRGGAMLLAIEALYGE